MKKVVFVCLSHILTQEQIADLAADGIVLVSPELGAKTRQIPANASLDEIKLLAMEVVKEARTAKATHFVCQGEPTFAMWANLFAGYGVPCPDDIIRGRMKCIVSTTERVSVDTPQADGTIVKTSVFKHVQWRPLF